MLKANFPRRQKQVSIKCLENENNRSQQSRPRILVVWMGRHASAFEWVQCWTYKSPITALLGRKCRSQPSTFLSLPFPRFWGRVVPEWLNYRLLEDFSFCWFPTIMAGNMTRLLCAPPKDNRFGSFLQCQRGRVVGLWVVIMRSGVRFLSWEEEAEMAATVRFPTRPLSIEPTTPITAITINSMTWLYPKNV